MWAISFLGFSQKNVFFLFVCLPNLYKLSLNDKSLRLRLRRGAIAKGKYNSVNNERENKMVFANDVTILEKNIVDESFLTKSSSLDE